MLKSISPLLLPNEKVRCGEGWEGSVRNLYELRMNLWDLLPRFWLGLGGLRDFAAAAGGEQQHVRSGSFDDEERERYLTRSGLCLVDGPSLGQRRMISSLLSLKLLQERGSRYQMVSVSCGECIPQTANSQETLRGEREQEQEQEWEYEPSPTNNHLRAKEKDHLLIPKPLPTLPSEAKTPKWSATTSSATIGRDFFEFCETKIKRVYYSWDCRWRRYQWQYSRRRRRRQHGFRDMKFIKKRDCVSHVYVQTINAPLLIV